MPDELQSILLEDLHIEWPGVHIRRLALNQHMPRVEKLSKHRHSFSQILLYLRGSGTQQLPGSEIPVQRGSLLLIEAKAHHRFVKNAQVRPVCLALDLDLEKPSPRVASTQLKGRDLSRIEGWLFKLSQCPHEEGHLTIRGAHLILRILNLLCGKLDSPEETGSPGPITEQVLGIMSNLSYDELSPTRVAREFGRSLDHLNRRLREEESPTAGQLIQSARLRDCQELLRRTDLTIGEIGSRVGIDDQNYFARWFRKQTGQSPGRWRKAMKKG